MRLFAFFAIQGLNPTVETNSKWTDSLVGLNLERLELTSGSVDFAFEGERDGKLASLKAGTAFEVCCSTDALFQRDIANDSAELASLYDCLGRQVVGIHFSGDGRHLSINLSDECAILVWSAESPTDNLLIIRDLNSKEWGVIG
ncbi:MAG: hypothetical protein AAF351_00740 [Pseudomonadota bacterium]